MSIANDILKRIDFLTGVDVNYKETTTWYDGSAMTDAKADGIIYKKKGAKYYRKTIDPTTLLKIPTIAQLRLTNGYYEGQEITLLGYYASGDKKPLTYKFTITNYSTLVDDGGSIIKATKGSWIAQFENYIETSHFGLVNSNLNTPTVNAQIINRTFDYAFNNNIKKTIINKGTHIVKSETIFYKVPQSELVFEGTLKLQDNDSVAGTLTGCRIIAYSGDDITIINQQLDGNRSNQVYNPQTGTQFSFTGYGYMNKITFKGGSCINSIQSHCQFIAKEVIFENYNMTNSGEHGIYYSLNIAGIAGEQITMNNCKITNIGLITGGHCVSSRAVKKGIYNNCTFDEGTDFKGGQCVGVSIYYSYRDAYVLLEEEFKHVFNNCIFIPSAQSVYSVGTRLDSATPGIYTLEEYVQAGKGVYLNDCKINSHVGLGVINADKCIFRYPQGNTTVRTRLPIKTTNSKFYNLFSFVPTELLNIELDNCEFYNTDTNNRIIFDANSINGLTNRLIWAFKNCIFNGYTTQTSLGIIRNSGVGNELIEVIVDGNKLYNCTNAVFVNVGALNNSFIAVNNSDATKSGVVFRFNSATKPTLVKNNDFMKYYGITSEKPTSTALNIGYLYYNTDLNIEELWNGTTWESREGVTILNVDDITKFVSQYSSTNVRGAGYIYFGGNTSANRLQNVSGITLDITSITLSTTRACITTVETLTSKSFKVSTVTSNSATTRIGVRCYDLGGVLIDLTATTPPVTALDGTNFFWSDDFKMWRSSVLSNDLTFKVNDTVSKIDVIITTSTGTLKLESFKIISYNGKTRMLDKYNENLLATALPTITVKEGTFYYNITTSLKIYGWIYINSAWVEILSEPALLYNDDLI